MHVKLKDRRGCNKDPKMSIYLTLFALVYLEIKDKGGDVIFPSAMYFKVKTMASRVKKIYIFFHSIAKATTQCYLQK